MKVACAVSSLFTGYNESYLAVLSHGDVYFCCIRLGPWTKTCHVTVISFLFHSALIVFSESRKSACETNPSVLLKIPRAQISVTIN